MHPTLSTSRVRALDLGAARSQDPCRRASLVEGKQGCNLADPRDDGALLVAFAREGDREALGEIVARRWPEAYRVARRVLGDPGSAEDAAQEALVALVRNAGRFEAGRPFGPWFQTLVVNAARKQARSRRRRATHETRAATFESAAVAPEGEARVVASEIESRLERLPLETRLPLVLHYYEGYTHDEVGSALGVPGTTARARVRRGVEELREALAGAAPALTLGDLEAWFAGAKSEPASFATPPTPEVSRILQLARSAATRSLAAKALGTLVTVGFVAALASLARADRSSSSGLSTGSPPAVASSGVPSLGGLESAAADSGASSAVPGSGSRTGANAVGSSGAVRSVASSGTDRGAPCLRGHVLDARSHASVAGARVLVAVREAYRGPRDSWQWTTIPESSESITDALGAFEFPAIKRGLRVRHDDEPLAEPVEVGVVVLAPGHEALVRRLAFERVLAGDVDLLVDPGAGLGLLGRVVDAAGQGVPGVRLAVAVRGPAHESGHFVGEEAAPALPPALVWLDEAHAHSQGGALAGDFEVAVETKAGGAFEVAGLPEGEATIGLAPDERTFVADGVHASPKSIPDEVEIKLLRSATLTVRVLGATGAAVAGARVVTKHFTPQGGQWEAPETTAADGTVRRDGLVPGAYELEVTLPRPGADADVPVDLAGKLELQPGEDRMIELSAAATSSLECRVKLASGLPAAGAVVWVMPAAETYWSAHTRRTATAGPDGIAVVSGLQPGTYKVEALESIFCKPQATVEVASTPGVVELTVPDRVDLSLVVVGPQGQPIAGAEIHLNLAATDDHADGTTDAGGRLTLRALPRGSAWAFVTAKGFRTTTDEWELDGSEVRVQLELGRDLVARGHVDRAVGARVDGTARAQDGSGFYGASGTVGADGKFELRWNGLPGDLAGTIEVRIGKRRGSRPFAAGDVEVDLGEVVGEGVTIHGRVADGGLLAAGGRATLFVLGPSGILMGDVKSDGSFTLTGLPLEPADLGIFVAPRDAEGRSRSATVSLDLAALAKGDLGTIALKEDAAPADPGK